MKSKIEKAIFFFYAMVFILTVLAMSAEDLSANQSITFNLAPPLAYNWTIPPDLDKIVWCIEYQETKNFTLGYGVTHNNGGGVMTWQRGYREARYYPTQEASTNDLKRIWRDKYGGRLPTVADAKKYSGMDRWEAWYMNVNWCYENAS